MQVHRSVVVNPGFITSATRDELRHCVVARQDSVSQKGTPLHSTDCAVRRLDAG